MKRFVLPLFLGLLLLSPGRLTTWDTGLRLEITRSLWKHGTVWVRLNDVNREGMIPSLTVPNVGTSFYGIGHSLLLIPFDMMGFALGKLSGITAEKLPWVENLPLVFLYGPLMGVLFWWTMVALLGTLGFAERLSRWASLLLLAGTTALVYSVQILQEEIPIAILLGYGTVLYLRYLATENRKLAFWGSLCLASTFLFRLNVLFALIPVAGLIADRTLGAGKRYRPITKAWPQNVAAAATTLIVFVTFSLWRFGKPFSMGYERLNHGIQLVGFRPELAWGTLFGFGKGFFILSPIAFLAMAGFWVQRRRFPCLAAGLLIALLVSALTYSRLSGAAFPDGSESWGSRFHTHLWIFFVVGLALWLEARPMHTGTRALVALSVALQIASCWAPDALEAYPGPGEGDVERKTRLLMSPTQGQLARRLRTVAFFYRSDFPNEWTSDEGRSKMVRLYVPNFWGPAYWSRLQGSRAAWMFMLLWSLNVVAVGGLVLRAVRRK